jgi:hypothetical protein
MQLHFPLLRIFLSRNKNNLAEDNEDFNKTMCLLPLHVAVNNVLHTYFFYYDWLLGFASVPPLIKFRCEYICVLYAFYYVIFHC